MVMFLMMTVVGGGGDDDNYGRGGGHGEAAGMTMIDVDYSGGGWAEYRDVVNETQCRWRPRRVH